MSSQKHAWYPGDDGLYVCARCKVTSSIRHSKPCTSADPPPPPAAPCSACDWHTPGLLHGQDIERQYGIEPPAEPQGEDVNTNRIRALLSRHPGTVYPLNRGSWYAVLDALDAARAEAAALARERDRYRDALRTISELSMRGDVIERGPLGQVADDALEQEPGGGDG